MWLKLKKSNIKGKNKNSFFIIKKILKDSIFNLNDMNKLNLLWDNKLLFSKNIESFNNNWQYKLRKMMFDLLYVKVGKRSYGRKNLDYKIYVDFDTQFIEGVFRFELLEGCNYSFTNFGNQINNIINQSVSIGENNLDTEFLKFLNNFDNELLFKSFENNEFLKYFSSKKDKNNLLKSYLKFIIIIIC